MNELMQQPMETTLERRYQRIMDFGVFEESGK
jgi:acetyl-CoA carboxylase carboxyl transferase subunit alpha